MSSSPIVRGSSLALTITLRSLGTASATPPLLAVTLRYLGSSATKVRSAFCCLLVSDCNSSSDKTSLPRSSSLVVSRSMRSRWARARKLMSCGEGGTEGWEGVG